MESIMRAGIIGATLIGNRGAEAMVSATVTLLRKRHKGIRFTLFSYFPKIDKKVAPDQILDIRSGSPYYLLFYIFPLSMIFALLVRFLNLRFLKALFPKALNDWYESACIIDVSGVSFMDVRMQILPYDILIIVISRILNTPFIKFAQAMGPFNNRLNKYAAKYFLESVDHIFARGEDTFTFIKSLDLSTSVVRSSDIALLHTKGYSLTDENSDYVNIFSNKLESLHRDGARILGICPSSVVYKLSNKRGFDYLGYLNIFVKECIDEGFHILLFPNATKDEDMSKIRNNDLYPILKIAQNARASVDTKNSDRILFIDRNINTDGIKQLVCHCDLTIVSRFHAMIASLELKLPVIVLGWSHKYLEVMRDFNLSEWVFDYKEKSHEELFRLTKKCHRSKDSIKKNIELHLPAVQQLSMMQIDCITTIMDNNTDDKKNR